MERVEYTISGNCHPGASLGQLHDGGNGEQRGNRTDMATQTWTNTQLALKANDADVTLAFAGYNVLLSQKAETSQVLTTFQ